MKRFALILAVLLLAVTLVSCGGHELVGLWQGQFDGTMFELSLEKDGVAGVKKDGRSYLGTWEATEGKLTVIADGAEGKETILDKAEYSLKDDSLTVKVEGREVALTKQEGN